MTLIALGAFFGILAGVIQALAYLDYNQLVLRGKLRPNGSTWLIWAPLAALNAATYFFTSDDWAKTFLSLVNTALCIGTLAIALIGKRFDKMDAWEIVALIVGLSSTLFWYYYRSAMYANFVLQIAIAIGFIPTYRMVWHRPQKERIRPWLLWTLAYAVLILAVVLRWRGQWQDMVYPVSMLVLHPAVAGLILIRAKKLSC